MYGHLYWWRTTAPLPVTRKPMDGAITKNGLFCHGILQTRFKEYGQRFFIKQLYRWFLGQV